LIRKEKRSSLGNIHQNVKIHFLSIFNTMKTIYTILFSILLIHNNFAQVVNYDFNFEAGSTTGFWNYFENGSNTTGVTFVPNPFPGGINTSATVAKFTASGDGGEWAGCESLYGTLGKWRFNGSSPTTVTIDVYKSTLSPVAIKFTSTNPAGQGTVFFGLATPSAINQWVTLTYVVDFAALGGENNADNNFGTNQFVIHVDKNANRGSNQDVYFDNLKFTANQLAGPVLPPPPVDPPSVAAPVPPARNPSDVISIFSNAYSNLPGTKIGKNWGEATKASTIHIDGDSIKRLLNFNYQGIVLAGPVNMTGFEKVHIDFFKTDQAQLKFSIINVGGGDVTKLLNISEPGWNSFDIPLTDFPGLNLATVHQMKLEGAPTQGNTTVYFDNLYLYKSTTRVAGPLSEQQISIFPNPASDRIQIEGKELISKVSVLNLQGQEVLVDYPFKTSSVLNTSGLTKGLYLVRVILARKAMIYRFTKE
jgi:hypothetical protein